MALHRDDFGEGFRFGVATAAFQIEGSTRADGRGKSIWDTFTEPYRFLGSQRSKIKNGDTAEVACDHYVRWEEDLDLMAQLGIDSYRFSLAWPRILPNGTGTPNRAGIDFYHRLIDGLHARGITPFVTLYHWDLPQALEDRGGWRERSIVDAFRGYAELCAREYGDKVGHWIVLNEGLSFTVFGHLLGVHAPGKRMRGNFLPAVHHAVLAEAEAVRVLKQHCPQAEVGSAAALPDYTPARPTEADRQAAGRYEALARCFVDPHLGRGYPIDDLPCMAGIERWVEPGDMERLACPLDFLGVNHYFRWHIRNRPLVPRIHAWPERTAALERTDIGWGVDPDGFAAVLRRWGNDPDIAKIYVTENGAAYDDSVAPDGSVQDERRRAFLERYLSELLKVKREGVRIDGYFAWTFTDNFEWAEGYGARFGLVRVDFETQRRTVKASGAWYRDLIRGS